MSPRGKCKPSYSTGRIVESDSRLATPESDTDIKGIFLYPTEKILSLQKGKETFSKRDPDIEHHEVEKFIKLAIKCNPTILEILFLDEYTKLTEEGKMLVKIRELFLSNKVFYSYGNYALDQAKKLYKRYAEGNEHTRHEKHARHCFRLLFQGKELLETKSLTVRLKDPDIFFEISKMEVDDMMKIFASKYTEFKNIKTDLPENPDYDKINDVLVKIRRMNLGRI